MVTAFLHGAEVVEITDGARPIQIARSSVVGIVVTAPKGPVNQPVGITRGSLADVGNTFGVTSPSEGFTAYPAAKGVLDQIGTALVMINVLDPAIHKVTVAPASKTFNANGLVTLPHKYVRAVTLGTSIVAQYTLSGTPGAVTLPTGHTVGAVKSADGVTTYTVSTDYTVSGTTVTRVAGGTIPVNATLQITSTVSSLATPADYTVNSDAGTVSRVNTGKIPAGATLTIGYERPDPTAVDLDDVIGTGAAYTGVHGLRRAKGDLGLEPRIIAAPTFTAGRPNGNANPVTAELATVAGILKAVVVADIGNGTVAEALSYRQDWGNKRIYGVWPYIRIRDDATDGNVDFAPSAHVAGLISRVHNQLGFWWSPSNQTINGVLGTSQPVDYALNDPNTLANTLNENRITTIVREEGFRLWGNRTFSDDDAYSFITRTVIADIIGDSLIRSIRWAIDRPITKTYLEAVTESVNSYLREIIALGAIQGGRCWPDPDLNTPLAIAAGKVYLNFDFTPTDPAEHLIFRAEMTQDYYIVVAEEAIRLAA